MASTLFTGSKHAVLYSKFRPSPPKHLIDSIINYVKNKVHFPLKQAVDIGCGSGQSTIALSPYFENVTGFDISEAQIENARNMRSESNVEYKVSDCKKIPIPASTAQLVTFCQSIHWFNTAELFPEIKRILVPNGVLAVYGYWIPLPKVESEDQSYNISKLISEDLHDKVLGEYWNDERFIVQNRYADINLPFENVQRLNFIYKSESSLADYIGYLSTWSSYQKLCREDKEKGKKILKDVERQCLNILDINKPPEEVILQLQTDYFLLIGHL